MTDLTGHREGSGGRKDEHSCNGLFPYHQDLKFPVQHFTRCLIHLAYTRAERGRFTSQYPGLDTATMGACLGCLAGGSEWSSETIIYQFILR